MATKAKTPAAATSIGPSTAEQNRWQAEDDLRTLQRFQELKANSSRMKAVETHLKKQMAAVQQVKPKAGKR